MGKRMLWVDVRRTFLKSKGRFVSIVALLTLGAFALVGLKVAGPDMRATAARYLSGYQLADITVTGDLGLDADDEAKIEQASGIERVEYGYLKDVTVSGTHDAVRIWSRTDGISEFEVVAGRLPTSDDEVAIDSGLAEQHPIGSTIDFDEKAGIDGSMAMSSHSFTVVGVVNSVEIISSSNRGMTRSGTGNLVGYAVVTPSVFDVDYHMVARLSYEDTKGLDPFSQTYLDRVAAHESELKELLKDQPAHRLATVQAAYQDAIDAGQQKIDDAQRQLADARDQLADAAAQIADARQQIIDSGAQLADAAAQLASAREQLDTSWDQLAAGKETLDASKEQLASSEVQLKSAAEQLVDARNQLAAKQADYDAGVKALADAKAQAEQQAAEAQAQIDASRQKLEEGKARYDAALDELNEQVETLEEQLDVAYGELDARQADYDAGKAAYEQGVAAYNEGLATYYESLGDWQEGAAELERQTGEYEQGTAKLAQASEELANKEAEYESGLAAYKDAEPNVQAQIADGEASVADARATLTKLETPVYDVCNRRETPGSQGYKTYDSISEIVDSLANIFPYFLYLVAALVVSTTMTRMVDEERIGAGTLKALGYDDADVLKKFVSYGVAAALVGTTIGVILGHTLLPLIVYNTYRHGFTLPPIELGVRWDVSVACLALALGTVVLPAYLVAKRELAERPAALLLPKPPAAGSKILLERIGFIWRRLSFMRKVTARNLFRYKKRSLMTIAGVAGAVCLIFAGFAVQHSIGGIATKQFGGIIGYDLIVAQNSHVDDDEQPAIDDLMNSDAVASHAAVTYESLTKQAGSKNDEQSITLLVPDDDDALTTYLHLRNRTTEDTLTLSDDGAVISERLAELTGTNVGDTLTFRDANNVERSVTISGVCEMYVNHFMFMSRAAYEKVFATDAATNASVVTLRDGSLENTEDMAARFMALSGVEGVVQSTQLISVIDDIVTSLDTIMGVLIVVATLLAIVIIYNLVTINVSERIRELSTVKVLGFYDGEVSMYIYRETIVLSCIAIPAGWLFGRFLQLYIITAVPPEGVMFDPSTGWLPFAISVGVVAIVVWLQYYVVRHSLRKVDMLEALKSAD